MEKSKLTSFAEYSIDFIVGRHAILGLIVLLLFKHYCIINYDAVQPAVESMTSWFLLKPELLKGYFFFFEYLALIMFVSGSTLHALYYLIQNETNSEACRIHYIGCFKVWWVSCFIGLFSLILLFPEQSWPLFFTHFSPLLFGFLAWATIQSWISQSVSKPFAIYMCLSIVWISFFVQLSMIINQNFVF